MNFPTTLSSAFRQITKFLVRAELSGGMKAKSVCSSQCDLWCSEKLPHSGAITFGDLINKLGTLQVTCEQCGRNGRYSVRRPAAQHGHDGKVSDWLSAITSDCPRKRPINMADQCGAQCPDLVR
jgi:hypothetical protein